MPKLLVSHEEWQRTHEGEAVIEVYGLSQAWVVFQLWVACKQHEEAETAEQEAA